MLRVAYSSNPGMVELKIERRVKKRIESKSVRWQRKGDTRDEEKTSGEEK